ncbi:hypothetical protein [Streptomyces sp. NPDC029003]|uniref:hypothetical protein n=1 Tax=Streptomyces sp. NPDC029003 TaxID=3155125 RepID=UPI0033F79FE1
MDMEKRQPAPGAEGCLVGVLRVPVKIVAVLVVLPVRVVWDVLVAAARLLNRRVLGPVGRGLGRFHARVLRPVLGVLGRAAVILLKLVFVWPWAGLWRYALEPAGRGLAWLGRAAGTYLLRPLGEGLGRALRAVDRHLLRPLGRALALAGRAVGTALFVRPSAALWRYVLVPAGQGAAWVARGIGTALVWLGRALFVWPWAALWRYAARPVAVGAYRHLLAPLGRAAYAWLLAPLGRLLAGAWQLAGRVSRALGRGLVLLWRGLVARPCSWAYRQVATPVGHVVREVWRGARAAVREARAEVRRALSWGAPREPARSRARTLGSTTAVGTAPAPEISLHEQPQG